MKEEPNAPSGDELDYRVGFLLIKLLVIAIVGRLGYLVFTGNLEETLTKVYGTEVVQQVEFGRIISVDYLSEMSISAPVFYTFGNASVPLGGGSSSRMLTKVETDSGYVLLGGGVELKKHAPTFKRFQKNGNTFFGVCNGKDTSLFLLSAAD